MFQLDVLDFCDSLFVKTGPIMRNSGFRQVRIPIYVQIRISLAKMVAMAQWFGSGFICLAFFGAAVLSVGAIIYIMFHDMIPTRPVRKHA